MNRKSTPSFQSEEITLEWSGSTPPGTIHDNPDPDAIASAAALHYLAENRYGSHASIAYDGMIGRADNRAMVSKLNISMKQINRARVDRYDCITVVDTQPGAGNNSLPAHAESHIIIDHHPPHPNLRGEQVVINPEVGATATLLWSGWKRVVYRPNEPGHGARLCD